MPHFISLIGASGVGKTSLARALAQREKFSLCLEEHETRPFQRLASQDPHYTFPNQIDYLLFRAEQERSLPADSGWALMDGGLEQDFYGFTQLLHQRGDLSPAEFDLCRRLYHSLRLAQPAPQRIVFLHAQPEVIRQRLLARQRINLARLEEISRLQEMLRSWFDTLPPAQTLLLDVSAARPDYLTETEKILRFLQA